MVVPSDVKPSPQNKIFNNANIMVIGNTIVGEVLKEDNPLNEDLFNMKEIDNLKNKYNIKNVVITHFEEDFGKFYDDYIEFQKQYDNIIFAFDGLSLEL